MAELPLAVAFGRALQVSRDNEPVFSSIHHQARQHAMLIRMKSTVDASRDEDIFEYEDGSILYIGYNKIEGFQKSAKVPWVFGGMNIWWVGYPDEA